MRLFVFAAVSSSGRPKFGVYAMRVDRELASLMVSSHSLRVRLGDNIDCLVLRRSVSARKVQGSNSNFSLSNREMRSGFSAEIADADTQPVSPGMILRKTARWAGQPARRDYAIGPT